MSTIELTRLAPLFTRFRFSSAASASCAATLTSPNAFANFVNWTSDSRPVPVSISNQCSNRSRFVLPPNAAPPNSNVRSVNVRSCRSSSDDVSVTLIKAAFEVSTDSGICCANVLKALIKKADVIFPCLTSLASSSLVLPVD